ncbi:hypothetical protein WICPIJ_006145 [Wickerhamomyces pijperi]|uniref:CRAL-TRIO domain-containing protein n=1 Tax=Wickerhamomyces pijperi TaxID=599730 RepID=A0A9P8Q4Z2_WICPI|nr:hypothetical protein WICPIJ_006145 [Wickerhamomyces pijperi]
MFRSFSSRSATPAVEERQFVKHDKYPYKKPENIKVPEPTPLTAEEQTIYDKLLGYFSEPDYIIRSTEEHQKDEVKLPLYEEEKLWLTKDCLIRYARACKWDFDAAVKRLELSISWRREFGLIFEHPDVDHLKPETIKDENSTGKSILYGYDKLGRAILYLKNGRQNTKPSLTQVRILIFFLEALITMNPKNQGFGTLLIDFKHYDVPGTTAKIPNITISRQVLHILQTHYPERLGAACFINTPYLAHALLKMLMPFMDPATKSKIIIDESQVKEIVDLDELDKDYGGLVDFEFNHDQYWEDLVTVVADVRENWLAKFRELGGCLGLEEKDLKPF